MAEEGEVDSSTSEMAPEFVEPLRDVFVASKGTIELTCKVAGHLEKITWYVH